jgi:hypothetical protein
LSPISVVPFMFPQFHQDLMTAKTISELIW